MIFIRLIIISILLTSVGILHASNTVSVPDAEVERSKSKTIYLTGSLDVSTNKSITIELIYDSRIINISKAYGNSDFAVKSEKPETEMIFPRLDSAILRIKSDNIQSVSNGVIVALNIEGLIFSDSIAYITINKIVLDGNETLFDSKPGRIKVLGKPFLPNFPNSLGQNYPNPFITSTIFDFSLEYATKVEFKVYSSSGKQIYSSNIDNEIFKIYDENNNNVNDFNNRTLKQGKYRLEFYPIYYEFASGLYFMEMITDKGIIVRPFLIFK